MLLLITIIYTFIFWGVDPTALVRFHWSNKSRRAQNDEEAKRRAIALDGQLAIVIEHPLQPDGERCMIQSVDNPELILAVKWKYLEKVGPIKIELIYAPNDRTNSDEYYQKELAVLQDIQYTAVMTVHPNTRTSSWHIGNRIIPEKMEELCNLSDLLMLSQPDTLSNPEIMTNRMKDAIKIVLAQNIWIGYQDPGESYDYEEYISKLSGFDNRFKNILIIQFRSIKRHNKFQNMDWLTNDRISIKFMVQSLRFIHRDINISLRSLMSAVFDRILPHTSPRDHKLIAGIPLNSQIPMREHRNIRNHTQIDGLQREFIKYSKIMSRDTNRILRSLNVKDDCSGVQGVMRGLHRIIRNIKNRLQKTREMEMYCAIANLMDQRCNGFDQGNTIAIMVPGDLVLNKDAFERFVHKVLGMLKWEHRCQVVMSFEC